jgi:hypothetical protein
MRRLALLLLLPGLWLAVWFLTAEAVVHEDGRLSPEATEGGSQLIVTPTLLWSQLPLGEQDAQFLYIGNAGLTATLNYTISVLPFARTEGIVDWLQVGSGYGTVPTDSQVSIDVTFVPQPYMPVGSLHNASLRVDSNALVTPTVITVPVLLEVVEAVIAPVVTPTTLSADLPLGGTAWQTLTLGNEGNARLVFTMTFPADPSIRSVPWLSISPTAGLVAPGTSRVITATFDATDIPAGLHTTRLTIESNSQSAPSLTVPVSLTVEPARVYLPMALRDCQLTQTMDD